MFTALGIILLSAGAKAQCLEGGDFTYCPDADIMYVVTDTALMAVHVSSRGIKWRTSLPEGAYVKPVATAGIVAIIDGAPAHLRAYDASTGKPLWNIESKTTDLTALGPYILGDIDRSEGLITIDAQTGKIIRDRSMGNAGFVGFLASSDPLLLTTVFAVDARSGRLLMHWPKDWTVSAAAISGDLRIIGTESGGLKHGKLAVYSGPAFKMLWTRSDPKEPIVAGIAAEGDKMLVATYEEEHMDHPGRARLEMMSATTGKTIWTKDIMCDYMLLPTPVALTQGTAIFFMDDTRDSSVVEAFETATGKQKWIVHTDRRLTDGLVCAGAHCYMGAISYEILEVDAQSGAASWLSLPKQ